MKRPAVLLFGAAGLLAFLLFVALAAPKARAPRPGSQPEECDASECGPDGLPLSRYAG